MSGSPINYVSISSAAAGTLSNAIPAVTNAKIRITGIALTVATAGTITLTSHTSTGNTTGALNVSTAGLVLPYNKDGWFFGSPGEGVDVVFATGTNLAGILTYEVR